MKIMKFFGMLLSAFLVVSVVSANTGEITLYDAAVAEGRILSLSDAGLSDLDTLWVPARYIQESNASALYIKGTRYVSPDGENNVIAFTNMSNGDYLVVVLQDGVPVLEAKTDHAPWERFAVFYRVSRDGKTLEKLGFQATRGRVVTALDGIFVQVGTKGSSTSKMLGYDVDGNFSSGPQDVNYATPSSKGGWYVSRYKEKISSGLIYSYFYVAKDGTESYLGDSRARGHNQALNTVVAYANMPTYTDSTRTDFNMKVVLSGVDNFKGWWGSAYNFDKRRTKVKGKGLLVRGKMFDQIGHYAFQYGSYRGMNSEIAEDIAVRSALINSNGKPLYIGQIDPGDTKGVYVGIVDLLAQGEGKRSHSLLFNLNGSGMQVLRMVMGANSGAATAASANDVYTVVTPSGVTVVYAYLNAVRDGDIRAYNVGTDSVVNPEEVADFLRKHRISN